MLPTIEIGALRLNTYWLLYSLAIVTGGMLVFHRLLKAGIAPRRTLIGLWLVVWAGVVGSVLLKGVALVARDLALTGELTGLLNQGSAFVGALAGGGAAVWFWFRRSGVTLGRAFDLIFVPIPLCQAIGRIGCLAAACCHGKATTSWLGLYLPDHDGFWAVRYPTQLLSGGADLLIFIVLLWLERVIGQGRAWPHRLAFDGFLAATYFLLYAAKRFSIEFLRADTTLRLAGALTLTHVIYALMFLAALVLLAAPVFGIRGRAGAEEAPHHVPGGGGAPGTQPRTP